MYNYIIFYFRGKEFRIAFKNLPTLGSYFPTTPVVGLSGTITVELMKRLPKLLGFDVFQLIQLNPHRPNIFPHTGWQGQR